MPFPLLLVKPTSLHVMHAHEPVLAACQQSLSAPGDWRQAQRQHLSVHCCSIRPSETTCSPACAQLKSAASAHAEDLDAACVAHRTQLTEVADDAAERLAELDSVGRGRCNGLQLRISRLEKQVAHQVREVCSLCHVLRRGSSL